MSKVIRKIGVVCMEGFCILSGSEPFLKMTGSSISDNHVYLMICFSSNESTDFNCEDTLNRSQGFYHFAFLSRYKLWNSIVKFWYLRYIYRVCDNLGSVFQPRSN